jgi:hypothetical protein
MKFDMLDADKIRDLIKILESGLRVGLEFSASSPIDILLEAAIDLSLLLKDTYKEGGKFLKKTPGLKFSERFQDPLGNPKQLRVSFETQVGWDIQASEFFEALASLCVRLKNGDSFKGAFMALMEKFPELRTTLPERKSSEKSKVQKISTKSSSKGVRRKYYYRRCR